MFIDGAIAGIISTGGSGYESDWLPDTWDTWGELVLDTRISSFVGLLLEATDDKVAVMPPLRAGDANCDYQFDRFDIIEVLAAGKYLTELPARWNEGDWNRDGVFDQLDIAAAVDTGSYRAWFRPGQQFGSSLFYSRTVGDMPGGNGLGRHLGVPVAHRKRRV